ncbi:hypothetical protein VII00023_12036 [Vibrio ichthyoenteri ATCC 700023]|uniref:Uncharacterized protein n=2 Tax=Vibrio ichthyoenteri TaxID=142461 RepID=F9RYV6_9VIBR|nr:hypothetical protein VII00023_12036 [Vibrio ichthyoenteri ATCC 700023]
MTLFGINATAFQTEYSPARLLAIPLQGEYLLSVKRQLKWQIDQAC